MFHSLIFVVNLWIQTSRPSGAYRIAHHLRNLNWDVEVIDFASQWKFEELCELARSRITSKTKFIGFSHLYSHWPAIMERFSYWLKDEYPDILLISGSNNNPFFETDVIDYYISGYGEKAITSLLHYKFSNGLEPKISILDGKKIIDGIHNYPSYPEKSPMIKYQKRDFIQPEEFLSIEFSRGCKFKCAFCNFPILGVKGDYTRDAEGFREQIIHAYDNWGTKNYIVSDETFNDSTEKIIKYADVVETLPWRPWFSGFIRADLMVSREREREELLRMNFLGHYYGIESFNHETGKVIGKGMQPEKLQNGLIECKNYFSKHGNYRGTISIIIGLPYETVPSMENTINWLENNYIDHCVNSFVMEIPVDNKSRNSTIGLNYEKYGYKMLGDYKVHNGPFKNEILRISKNNLIWESKWMTMEQAVLIKERIENTFTVRDNFSIGDIFLDTNGNVLNLENRFKLTRQDHNDTKDKSNSFMDNYIQKKLSM
jgi:radical SAM superfamily enzyme YgiQ (UPF0313 family)